MTNDDIDVVCDIIVQSQTLHLSLTSHLLILRQPNEQPRQLTNPPASVAIASKLQHLVFSSALAFNRENYSFPSSELVEWWRLVLERLEREQQRSLIAEVGNE